jgi:cellulose synthase/poly-beta-1,6-N-acetylglucosamine synthase-like glycosyltransferase
MTIWLIVLAISAGITVYSYALYPLLLLLVSKVRRAAAVVTAEPASWPGISITLPAYNAQDTLRPVLESLVHADYPVDRRQILVVSDGSTDGTDDLVREYAAQGVELLRIEGRLGKTEIENRAMDALRGEIIVNTDASVTIRPDAVKKLVCALGDPAVGVASGRDVSVASVGAVGHASEAAYVGYEMWIRDLETAVDGIIGSSGCLYAVRAPLHRRVLPGHLSRDFSSALWARLNGARAVSVRDAICFVPRAANMRIEFRRKIRTMSRGIQTLFFHGRLLDPFRYGMFAWFLWSHKLVRWIVPWGLAAGAVALVALAIGPAGATAYGSVVVLAARAGTAGLVTGMVLSAAGWWWPGSASPPRLAAMSAYFVSGTVAGLIAWKRAILREGAPVWEPTPRALAGLREG